MNISSILFHQLYQFWWIPVAAIVLTIFKTPWFKGIFGEFLINIFTKLLLDKKVYRLLHNVTLTTPDGTTQIDHVIVSPFGSAELLRTIKSGVKQGNKFWGCFGFPKCRTVRAIPS